MKAATGIAALCAPLLLGAARVPVEYVVQGDALLPVRLNGRTATLRIDPAAPAMPLIHAELAERGGLKMTGPFGVSIGYAVRPVPVTARTPVVRIDFDNRTVKRRVGWTSRPFAMVADGSTGPEAMFEPIVRFQFHASVAGERTLSLPMDRDSGPLGMFGNFGTTYARIQVGGEPMRVRFDPYHARSLVTAAAGARIAAVHGVEISGRAVPTEIFFGVERPVRTLTLHQPMQLGTLSIATLGLRAADDGSVRGIRDEEEHPVHVDPDEVVVTAKGKKHDPRRDTLSLGQDYLSRCSSLVFDRDAGVIRLTCA
ncbi:hypothetical protein SOM26_10110 [Sphingomonas sp. CFBP8993]|uniref:hypothetical protein n=1 Tax=Sphingomonas sp. CFBP8993 TaxID=3096526 RepID=UPI002A69ED74|nr:hypothetical protein [Sphingomonas sp. CFBP8993]MDY0959037.1 hypothetical protein [Sphingomonas sp. CFBP8993]